MIKLSHEWAADRYGDRVQFLNLSNPRILEKLSSLVVHVPERILQKIGKLRESHPEGLVYPYIRAVGASEIFSSNRNGDWWFDDDLRTRYGSFEKEAHLFRHHCAVAGTPITLWNRTRRPIDEIQVGDKILDQQGIQRPVTRIFERHYNGAGIRIGLRGRESDLVFTLDHLALVIPRSDVHCRHKYSYLADTEHKKECRELRQLAPKPRWIPMDQIELGDYLVMPRPALLGALSEPDFAELVGWVGSEGYISNSGSIRFTFSNNSKKDIKKVLACLERNGLHPHVYDRSQYNCVAIVGNSTELANRLKEFVTGKLGEKRLTNRIFEFDRESALQLIGAYIDGNGHIYKSSHNLGQVRIRSSSFNMREILSDFLFALGISNSLNADASPGFMISPTNKKAYARSASGCVSIPAFFAKEAAVYSHKKSNRVFEKTATQIYENWVLFRVSDLEPVELDEKVYNLEVADEHSYIASDVVVHNCNDSPTKAIGKIIISEYNPASHTIDLLCEVPQQNVELELARLREGEKVATSIGAKVAWEQCSICYNKASSLEKRCSCLKTKMGEVLSDGRLVCAYNPNPRFFDISLVTIGAGEESEWLCEEPYEARGKTANVRIISSAELANWRGLTDEIVDKRFFNKTAAAKTSTIKKQIPGSIIGVLGKETVDTGKSLADAAPRLTILDLEKVKGRPKAEILSSLSAMGIVLRPEEYAAISFASKGKMKSATRILRKTIQRPTEAAVQKHGTINRMLVNPGLARLDIVQKLAYLLQRRSVYTPYLDPQKSASPTSLPKTSGLSKFPDKAIHQDYLDYRKTFPLDFFDFSRFNELVANNPKLACLVFNLDPFADYEKVAFEGSTLKHFLAPLGLSYLGAGYLVHRAAKKDQPIEGASRFIAEHPAAIGGAAGAALLARKLLKKSASDNFKTPKKARKPVITQEGFRNLVKGGIIFPSMVGKPGKLALDIGGQAVDYLALKQLGRAASKLAPSKKLET